MASAPLDRPSFAPRHWPVWLGVGLCMALARLPWRVQRSLGAAVGWLALRLLPVWAFDQLADFFGLNNAMDAFTGRPPAGED